MPHLQVVVVDHQPHKPIQKPLALGLGQPVDAPHVVAHREHAAPARHRVCADHGMRGAQLLTHVLGRAALAAVQLEAVVGGGLVEARLRVRGR